MFSKRHYKFFARLCLAWQERGCGEPIVQGVIEELANAFEADNYSIASAF